MFVCLFLFFNVTVRNRAGRRPPTRCDFNFALHYERRDYFGIILMQGFFNVRESNGDLTQDHYFSSIPPIERSLKEFSHNRKILRWSGRDSNPRLRTQRQARSALTLTPLSHPITLV